MKTFQIASIVAVLSFLKPIVAKKLFYCGPAEVSVEHVDSVAKYLWTHKIWTYQSDHEGAFPHYYGESDYGELRKFPLLPSGFVWTCIYLSRSSLFKS
ncbi:putative secreted effector protein [Blumeria graminis f. sp. tritici 96224]|nr:putative secreted effector protein [Blumeria graminis f. sp. tritici 96224]